jgi:hypothetical protein
VRHRQRRLRGDVARRRAGAAGGEDERTLLGIGQFDQRGLDQRLLVGNQPGDEFEPGWPAPRRTRLQGGQAPVFVDAAAGAVADGNQADADGSWVMWS